MYNKYMSASQTSSLDQSLVWNDCRVCQNMSRIFMWNPSKVLYMCTCIYTNWIPVMCKVTFKNIQKVKRIWSLYFYFHCGAFNFENIPLSEDLIILGVKVEFYAKFEPDVCCLYHIEIMITKKCNKLYFLHVRLQ